MAGFCTYLVPWPPSLAENGNFTDAIRPSPESLDRLPEDSPDREKLLSRLHTFERGEPYREYRIEKCPRV